MNVDDMWSLAGAIVTVALVTTVVMRPQSADIIGALGRAFSDSLRAAMGR